MKPRDEARRIAANIAKLSEMLQAKPCPQGFLKTPMNANLWGFASSAAVIAMGVDMPLFIRYFLIALLAIFLSGMLGFAIIMAILRETTPFFDSLSITRRVFDRRHLFVRDRCL
jgi:hypothetical protein